MTNHTDICKNRKIDCVIFLGAGASCSEGAPSQSQLFKKAFQSINLDHIDPSGHLKKYFTAFWGIDITNDNLEAAIFPTFEEALGMLELARNRQEAFKGFYSNANQRNIDHTIEDLIYLIAEVLKTTLQNQNNHHTRLIDNLKSQKLLTQCCFLSLNYDILIDNALIGAKDVCDIDYGIDFMNFEYRSSNDYENWDKPDYSRTVKLFKIHGSLNWLYCPVCNKIKITPKTKAAAELAYINKDNSYKCDICRGNFTPILIPPTYYKNMTNYHISSVWCQAEQTIMNCKKIIFCGYSLPDADMHIKYLLKRGFMNRSQRTPEIIIVNNHTHKDNREKKSEKMRFERLFGKEIKCTEKSFEKFSENPGDLVS